MQLEPMQLEHSDARVRATALFQTTRGGLNYLKSAAECEALALQITGGRRAVVFDHLVRRADPTQLNLGRCPTSHRTRHRARASSCAAWS
jgi:hypothetical protein